METVPENVTASHLALPSVTLWPLQTHPRSQTRLPHLSAFGSSRRHWRFHGNPNRNATRSGEKSRDTNIRTELPFVLTGSFLRECRAHILSCPQFLSLVWYLSVFVFFWESSVLSSFGGSSAEVRVRWPLTGGRFFFRVACSASDAGFSGVDRRRRNRLWFFSPFSFEIYFSIVFALVLSYVSRFCFSVCRFVRRAREKLWQAFPPPPPLF